VAGICTGADGEGLDELVDVGPDGIGDGNLRRRQEGMDTAAQGCTSADEMKITINKKHLHKINSFDSKSG